MKTNPNIVEFASVKMVKLMESTVVEFEKLKQIELCCKHCGVTYAGISDVKSFSKFFWKISDNYMNWDVQYIVVNGIIVCECMNNIGKRIDGGILLLEKDSCKLMY